MRPLNLAANLSFDTATTVDVEKVPRREAVGGVPTRIFAKVRVSTQQPRHKPNIIPTIDAKEDV